MKCFDFDTRFLRKYACKHIMKFFTSPFGILMPYAKMFSGGCTG
jgi:hypothetical protein